MFPFETYCKILQLHQENLHVSQIAAVLSIDERTVQKWIDEKCYHQRITTQRASKLDPYKARTSSDGWNYTLTAASSYYNALKKWGMRVE